MSFAVHAPTALTRHTTGQHITTQPPTRLSWQGAFAACGPGLPAVVGPDNTDLPADAMVPA